MSYNSLAGQYAQQQNISGAWYQNQAIHPGSSAYSINQQTKPADSVSIKTTKGKPIMEMIKNYFEKHRDILFNLALILLVDHFVFNGAFREKIKGMLDRLVDKTHKLIDEKKD